MSGIVSQRPVAEQPWRAAPTLDDTLITALAELCRRLRAGESVRAETHFAEPMQRFDDERALELVYSEYVERRKLNEAADPREYYNRFPYWMDRLERLFGLYDLLSETETLPELEGTVPYNMPAGYEIERKLGRGGMAVVFLARQLGLDRFVALKVLKSGPWCSPDDDARNRRSRGPRFSRRCTGSRPPSLPH